MENLYNHSKFIIDRFDHYFDSVNNKGNYYLTLNAFLIGAVFTAYLTFNPALHFNNVLIGLMSLSIVLGVASIIVTQLAVNPFLKSGNSAKHQSLIYFGSISSMKESEFINDFVCQQETNIQKDMLTQVHHLAEGLTNKYKKLNIAGWLVVAQFVVIIIVAISIITNK
jgi:hypothetical protein